MEILDCPLETPYAFDMGRKCCEVRERLSVIVFTEMRFKKLKPEWNPELDPDRTQVRIGSDPTNKRLLSKYSLCSRKITSRSAVSRRCKFRKFELYVDTLFAQCVFISCLWSNLTLQIIPEILNLRSSAAEDPSLEERKTQGSWFLLNSRPSKIQVLTWVLLGSKQTQRLGFTRV